MDLKHAQYRVGLFFNSIGLGNGIQPIGEWLNFLVDKNNCTLDLKP